MTALLCEQIQPCIDERSADFAPTPNRPDASPEQTGEPGSANDVIRSSDMMHQVLELESSRPIFVTSEALEGTNLRGKDITNLWVATLDGDFVKVEEVLGESMRGECSMVLRFGLAYDDTTIFSSDKLKQDAMDYKAVIREDWIKLLGHDRTVEIKRSYKEMVDNHQITGADLEAILNELPAESLERIFGTNDNSRTTARSDEETSSLASAGEEVKPEPTPSANKQPVIDSMTNQFDNWPKSDLDTRPALNLADESFS